jgi:hypothetical protein
VFELFTDEAHQAIKRAAQEARRLGARMVDPGHLLLGLVTVNNSVAQLAMARLGVTAEALRASSPKSVSDGSEGSIPFRAETKAALECALREAVALGNRSLTTGHLLLGVAHGVRIVDRTAADDERASADIGMTGSGTDVDAVRAAVLQEHANGSSPEIGGRPLTTAWSDLQMGPAPRRIPGRRSGIVATVAAIGWYAVLCAAIVDLTWDEIGPETFAAALVVFAGALGLTVALQRRRLLAKQLAKSPVALDPPEAVADVLARRGLTAKILVTPGPAVQDRCYRRGSTAWIMLAPRTVAAPQRLGFVVAHEVAHLLRDDHVRRRVRSVLGAALVLSAYLTLDPRAWLIAFGGVIGVELAIRWRTELACDAVAVRWVGPAALRAWADDHCALLRELPNRGVRRRLRRVRNLFTHPPLALRKAVHGRSA